MRHLSHKRSRFFSIAENYSTLYSYSNSKEQIINSAGVLNSIWNSWNNFWRDYWIAHVIGGYDFSQKLISPIFLNYTDKQACHYLLFAYGKRKKHNFGDTLNYNYQELTWGDPDVISKIASSLLHYHSSMNSVLGVLSYYYTSIQHFQRIRNTFIHLNNENVYCLNSIASHYSFSQNQEPIDILEAKDINSQRKCFEYLVDSITGMIKNL